MTYMVLSEMIYIDGSKTNNGTAAAAAVSDDVVKSLRISRTGGS